MGKNRDKAPLYSVEFKSWPETSPGPRMRKVLSVTADSAWQFECDLPYLAPWPLEVEAAWRTLTESSTSRRKTGLVPSTGIMSARDPRLWNALLDFAPYALDGRIWSRDLEELAVFGDRSALLYLRLDIKQLSRITREVEGLSIERMG